MSKTFKTVTTILIAVLAFFIVIFTMAGIFELTDAMRTYTVSESSMGYALEDGRYGDLVEDYHRNAACGAKTTAAMENYYAVARYYEAALDYQLAVQNQDTAQAEEYKARMDAAAKEMGEFSDEKQKIDTLLGI